MNSLLHDSQNVPPPLEFLKQDFIHPANRELLESEQKRWRLLGPLERFRLRRYVASLARDLRRGNYNQRVLELDRLRQEIRQAKAAYKSAASAEVQEAAKARILAIIEEARPVWRALRDLKETHAAYTHYRGWLAYEAEHRDELKRQDKKEKQTRKLMRREGKWIEQIIRDVWRMNPACHHMYKDDRGREHAKVPRFTHNLIEPDAHVFYLAIRKPVFFGLGYRFLLPRGVSTKHLTDPKVMDDLRAATGRQVDAIWTEQNQLTFRVARLDSPDALPKSVQWRDVMQHYPEEDRDKMPYPVGVSEQRRAIWFDFAKTYNVLVAGKAGSGKSNLVNAIIATLASLFGPDQLRIVMIDMKGGVEFGHWHELPHVLGDVVKTIDGVKPLLKRLVAIVDRRYQLMEKVKAKDFASYNRRVATADQFPRILILMDEMNTFVGLKETSEIHNLITLLVSKGRACGINVIGATQHPDRDVVPGRIKTNMDVRLCGFMPSITASYIVLDGPEAAEIANLPGRFVAQRGLETKVVQVPFVSDEDIAGVVSSCQRAYSEVSETLPEMADEPKVTRWDEQRMLCEVLDVLQGQLSADKLHDVLGTDESPGQRALRRFARNIQEQVNTIGYVTLERDGRRYGLKKVRTAMYLVALSTDSSDPASTDSADSTDAEIEGDSEDSVYTPASALKSTAD